MGAMDTPLGTVQQGRGESPSKYVLMQIRHPEGKWLRIQCPKRGGDHFEASRLPFSAKLTTYVDGVPTRYPSLVSGGSNTYVLCFVRPLPGGRVKMQIPGPKANRSWGASVTVEWPEVRFFAKKLLALARDKGKVPKAPTPKDPLFVPVTTLCSFNVGDRVSITGDYGVLPAHAKGIVVGKDFGTLAVSWKGIHEGHDCNGEVLPFGPGSGYFIFNDAFPLVKKGWGEAKKGLGGFKLGDEVVYTGAMSPELKGHKGVVSSVSSLMGTVFVKFPGFCHNNGKGYGAKPESLTHAKYYLHEVKGGDKEDCPF